MREIGQEIGNSGLVMYAIPVFLLMIAVEALYGRARQLDIYHRQDAFASLAMGIGNVVISGALKGGWLLLFFALYEYRVFDLDPLAWWVWVLAIVGEDFFFYWYHRISHRVRLLWAAHVNHHSSEKFNLTTALRQSWTTPLYSYAFFLPLVLLGIHPLIIATAQAISLIYQFFIHTETVGRLGPLEWVFNTPSHHRVHHGSNPRYIDRNYGGILIVWDRLFGTFEPEGEKVHFGLTHNIRSYNPLWIAFHYWVQMAREIRRDPRLSNALGVLFRGPEWQPPGQDDNDNAIPSMNEVAAQ
jgi:sterol desaturase/sphingolipid hydroxylase (fatty acid hydroxylase superfamily)